MPKRQAGDAILDVIADDLGVSKRKTKSKSVRCPTGEAPTASSAGPTGVSDETVEHPTGVVTDHDGGTNDTQRQSTVISNPTGGCPPVPVLASTSAQADGAQSDTRQLQSTVEALANQMAWFVEKMTQAEEAYDESGQQEVDEASVVLSTHSAPMTDTSPEGGEAPALDTLTGLERFYNVADTVGADVDQQLATIVTNLAKNRLPEEKLKEKLATYVRPGNCEALTVTRVNGEIWEKLSAATKSRDLKAQRGQNATVQAMVAITTAADNLVVGTRSGETLSQEKMAVTLTGLVDALALLNYANQDVNQRRREDHRGDLTKRIKAFPTATPTDRLGCTATIYRHESRRLGNKSCVEPRRQPTDVFWLRKSDDPRTGE